MRQVQDRQLEEQQYEQWVAGVESVLYLRCMKHFEIPAYNSNEDPGECAACVVEAIKEGLNNLLLDLYPLTIANAPMTASEQRLFADDVAGHIGNLRKLLGEIPNPPLELANESA